MADLSQPCCGSIADLFPVEPLRTPGALRAVAPRPRRRRPRHPRRLCRAARARREAAMMRLAIAVALFWLGVLTGIRVESRMCYATADLPWLACPGYRR